MCAIPNNLIFDHLRLTSRVPFLIYSIQGILRRKDALIETATNVSANEVFGLCKIGLILGRRIRKFVNSKVFRNYWIFRRCKLCLVCISLIEFNRILIIKWIGYLKKSLGHAKYRFENTLGIKENLRVSEFKMVDLICIFFICLDYL